MSESRPAVVLGLGNVLLSDDGAGVEAVTRLLARYELSPDVVVLDGGTLGLSLLPWVTSARTLILVDAVTDDAPAGSLVHLEGDEVPPATMERLSPHQIGVADLLFGARVLDCYPQRVVLLGIVPETIALGTERSPAVEAGLDALVESVATEVARLGFTIRPRAENAPVPAGEVA